MSAIPRRALSIRQPWAWLIVNGHKDVENRTWLRQSLGRFLVHASKGMTRDEYFDCEQFALSLGVELPSRHMLDRGGIVGVATHTHVVGPNETSHAWHVTGQFGYVLKDQRRLPFVECSGMLGLWSVPTEVLEEIAARVKAAEAGPPRTSPDLAQ